MPELNKSYVNQKRGFYSSSFQESSYVSPTIEGSDGTEEKSPRSRLEILGKNLLDDGEGSDVHESYAIEIVSEIKKNLTALCLGKSSALYELSQLHFLFGLL